MKPAFDSFVLPTSRYADIVTISTLFNIFCSLAHQIVPGSNNSVAIDLITKHVRKKLEERHNLFRGNLIYSPITPVSDRFSFDIVKHGHSILGIHILRNTPQLRVRAFCPWYAPTYPSRVYTRSCEIKRLPKRISFSSLTACRLCSSKMHYNSCPSCPRPSLRQPVPPVKARHWERQ